MDMLPKGRAARAWSIVVGMLTLGMVGGCNMLAAIGYVLHEDADEADFKDLTGKRVAIVCRPVENLRYADWSAAPDLAAGVGSLLREKVKKCQIISSSDVAEWADEHNWNEYAEVGKALKADMVVGIDLEAIQPQRRADAVPRPTRAFTFGSTTSSGAARWSLRKSCRRPSTRRIRPSRRPTGQSPSSGDNTWPCSPSTSPGSSTPTIRGPISPATRTC